MKFSLIAAVSQNHVIRKNNQLPWYIPEDLKYFKEKTEHQKIIMGRKTFQSMDALLPNRTHIIISTTIKSIINCLVFSSLTEAIKTLKKESSGNEEIFIIGGSFIFNKAFELDILDKLYITKIHQDFDGDVFLPSVPYQKYKLINNKSCISKQNSISLNFEEYERISY